MNKWLLIFAFASLALLIGVKAFFIFVVDSSFQWDPLFYLPTLATMTAGFINLRKDNDNE